MIFLDFNTTGDGMLSGIQLLNIMKQTGKKLSELAAEVTIYPQKLVNIRVSDKNGAMDVPARILPSDPISASASSITFLIAGTSIAPFLSLTRIFTNFCG